MNVDKMICKAIREKPATRRSSSKVTAPVPFFSQIRMGLNENPFGMSPKALEAIKETAVYGNRYGDFQAYDLKMALAEEFDVDYSQVITAPGSSALIEVVGTTFLDEGDEVLLCMPTFAAFLDMAYGNLAKPVIIDLKDDMSYNLEGILENINEKTKVIVICNPNNPTGTGLTEEEIGDFINKVPEDIVIVMDEAYIELATKPGCVSMYNFMKNNPEKPIVILRTFSKYYGMAGVRVGYALAQPEIIAAMSKCSGIWSISRMGQAAAIAALKDKDHGEYVKKATVEVREYLMSELEALGCKVIDSQTNFIFFDAHINPQLLKEKMADKGIQIDAYAYSRVSTGTRVQCELFIQYMKEIIAEAQEVEGEEG